MIFDKEEQDLSKLLLIEYDYEIANRDAWMFCVILGAACQGTHRVGTSANPSLVPRRTEGVGRGCLGCRWLGTPGRESRVRLPAGSLRPNLPDAANVRRTIDACEQLRFKLTPERWTTFVFISNSPLLWRGFQSNKYCVWSDGISKRKYIVII